MEKRQLLVDMGARRDDAIALWCALRWPDAEVCAVTCVGPDQEEAAARALEVAALAGAKQMPVARGAVQPLLRRGTAAGTARQEKRLPLPDAGRMPAAASAAELIVQTAEQAEGGLTIVTLGPLTNLALAAARDPELGRKLKRVVALGGAIRVPGDVTPVAEANVYADPEAARFVLEAGLPLTLVPLDATRSLSLPAAAEAWPTLLGPVTDGAARLDALAAMLVALCPEAARTERMKLAVECQSALSAGAVLADLRAVPRVGTDVDVCVAVDAAQAYPSLQAIVQGEEGSR
ncbi:nucleoside hydrolase [Brevibacillus thermoruber]|uniref:Nucleoside hydrolase n=1 Tax=Brevibacillus thermoruber TaxID=33942 RepID=A0A9X3TPD6_9BACL|nr:nucleoside hydrolase [Brevibacillus thermoruber]MDA5108311.1 nucleoside hydrolase [Brevibacillus thermoruber]